MNGYAEVESTGVQTGLGENYGFSFCYIEFEMPMDIWEEILKFDVLICSLEEIGLNGRYVYGTHLHIDNNYNHGNG